MRDLVEDENGDWYNLEGQPLVGALLSSRTKTLQDVEQVRHAHTCCCGSGEGLPKCARLAAGCEGGLALRTCPCPDPHPKAYVFLRLQVHRAMSCLCAGGRDEQGGT